MTIKEILEDIAYKKYQSGGGYYNQPYNYSAQFNYIPSTFLPDIGQTLLQAKKDFKDNKLSGQEILKNKQDGLIKASTLGLFGALNNGANYNYYQSSLSRQQQLQRPNYTTIPYDETYQSNLEDNYQAYQAGGEINKVSRLGYSQDSPYKNRPYNDIYSPHITMKNTEFPLKAQTDTGETKIMYPGNDYYFPNAKVVRESPLYQSGGEIDDSWGQYDYSNYEPKDTTQLFGNDEEDYGKDDELPFSVSEEVKTRLRNKRQDDINLDIPEQDQSQVNRGNTFSQRNQNAGNLKYAPWMDKYGAIKGEYAPEKDGTYFAKFPNYEASMAAQRELLTSKNYRDLTVPKALGRYAANTYTDQKFINMFGNKKVRELNQQELAKLQKEIIRHEDANTFKKIYGK